MEAWKVRSDVPYENFGTFKKKILSIFSYFWRFYVCVYVYPSWDNQYRMKAPFKIAKVLNLLCGRNVIPQTFRTNYKIHDFFFLWLICVKKFNTFILEDISDRYQVAAGEKVLVVSYKKLRKNYKSLTPPPPQISEKEGVSPGGVINPLSR